MPRTAPPMYPPLVLSPEARLDVVVVGSAKATSNVCDVVAENKAGLFLVGIQVQRSHTVATACRAGIYVRVFEVRSGFATRNDKRRVLWGGYYRDGAVPAGVPNIKARPGYQFVAQAWGLAEFNGEGVSVTLQFDNEPAGGTSIPIEAPGSGPGQEVVVSLGDPAPGAEHPAITVPAVEAWSPAQFFVTLTTSAVVANRTVVISYDDGANTYAQSATIQALTASNQWRCAFARGLTGVASSTNGRVQAGLGSHILQAGHRIVFFTPSLDAGDNYAAGFALVEKWVMPDG